ncbi:hypothetical protein IEI94_05705 [Halomonas sp. ML-15]|uniref:hypothetical protein n=1 Tax=Halomonas sp. ML-15 TaxID=2773305 RepID=UPI0017463480|nr:hypothetical protein [Halomonas sp. ML-15]MBD3895341.1 hypothetical protein [Halomonas sp. ML-15]
MICRKGLIFSIVVTMTMVMGCSSEPESVAFAPEKGDTRSYQLFSEGRLGSGSSNTGRDQVVGFGSVLRYEVLDIGRSLNLAITPRYLEQSVDGRREFSTMDPSDTQNPVMRELMSAGFEVDIDSDSGEVRRFTSRNEDLWQTLQEDGLAPLLEIFEEQMTTGMAMPEIPLTEGEVVTVSGSHGAADLQITVHSVTDTELVTTLQTDHEEVKLAGTMVLERETGWLRRLAVVSEVSQEDHEGHGTVRQALVMLPEDEPSWLGAWLINMAPSDPDDYVAIQPGPSPEEFDGDALVDGDTVLTAPVGTWVPFSSEIVLEIDHDLPKGAFSGYLDFADLRIESEEGEVLDVGLQQTMRYAFYHPDRKRHTTQAWYVPLGWGDELAPLERAKRLTATGVAYRPVAAEALDLPLDSDQKTEVTSGDIRAEAIPTDSPREFLLRFHSTPDHWFGDRIYGIKDAITRRIPEEDAPDWLTSHEAWMLQAVAIGRSTASDLRVEFEEGKTPDSLTLFALSESEAVPVDGPVRFVTEEARYSDIDLPPPFDVTLYPDGDEPPQVGLADLELPDAENNRALFRLPASLAAMCEPVVVEAPKINNQPLVWQHVDEDDAGNRQQLPTEQKWQLITEDGVRKHFYDIEVESELRCRGEGEWQTVDLALGDKPWLVRLDELPDAVDQEQSMSRFLQRYRFVSEQGDALAPMPRERYSDVSLATASIADYLNEGDRLRLAGSVQRVERFEGDGQPDTRRWSLRYAPLP